MGLFFIPVGIILVVASNSVVVAESVPYEICPNPYVSDGSLTCAVGPGTSRCPCREVSFNGLDMKAPVYMYYKLENFYQNHRRYVKSRSDAQLAGDTEDTDSLGNCDPYKSLNDTDNDEDIFLPCGLIARSMFTDSFRLVKVVRSRNDTEAPTVEYPVPMTHEGVAWEADIKHKFKNPPENSVGIRTIPNFKDPDFAVWMRTAALPTFQKLYRVINEDLKGDYKVYIQNSFDVESFDGHKYVVLSTTSWLGGKNPFLGYVYIVGGSVCVLIALLFAVKQQISPRVTGDTSYLEWQ